MSTSTPAPPVVRAYASRGSGVHTISPEEATRLIRDGETQSEDGSHPLVWVDVSNPGEAEANYLRDELRFHPLSVEDCIRGRQRPKLDRYPGYFFLVAYAASINQQRDRMALNEVHIFLGKRFLVTVHDHKVAEVGEVVARWRATPQQPRDVGALAHQLLDAVVDDYFGVLGHFADRVEQIEGGVFDRVAPPSTSQILLLRHELVLFRRVVAPLRDVLSKLLRRDLPFLRPELTPYFQDVHDHTIRVTEEIDALRELLSALLDAQLSTSANQLNEIVRMMTAWSIILMSMTLVAGIYGMNFRVMPELEWTWGYPFALGLMVMAGAALVAYFRRRGWL